MTLNTGAIEVLAVSIRKQLAPTTPLTEAVPLHGLREPHALDTLTGRRTVQARRLGQLPSHVYAMTAFAEPGLATIWLHRAAWPELAEGVPRTRFTVAHELGHVAMHSAELAGVREKLETRAHTKIEREANRFAAHLLIPDAALAALPASELEISRIVGRFGVSDMVAERRLSEWAER